MDAPPVLPVEVDDLAHITTIPTRTLKVIKEPQLFSLNNFFNKRRAEFWTNAQAKTLIKQFLQESYNPPLSLPIDPCDKRYQFNLGY